MLRFAVHRPGNPVASPRSHRMSCGKVHGRVHVSVAGESAGGTAEDGLTLAGLPVHMSARATALARKRGLDFLDPAGGLFFQATDQHSPAGREDLPIKSGFLPDISPRVLSGPLSAPGHVPDAKILDTNQVESASQVGTDLLAPILTSIGLPSLEPGGGDLSLGTVITAALRASEPALQQHQAPLKRLAQPRTAQQLTCGQSSADCYATINADDLTVARRLDRPWDCSESQVPPASAIHGDPKRLNANRNCAGQAESNPAALGDEYFPGLPVQLAHVPGLDRDHAEPLITSSLAPRRHTVSTGEEVAHGLVEVAKCLLLHHLAAQGQPLMLPASGGELPALLQVSRRVCSSRTPPRLLLTGEIPNEPSMRAMLPQHCFFGRRRKQAVPGHTKTLSIATDIPKEVKRRSLPCSLRGFVTPRTA
jgi:hypothetical protein